MAIWQAGNLTKRNTTAPIKMLQDVAKEIVGYRLTPVLPEKLREEQINNIAEIVAEIWLSGKNDSQVFDYYECSSRQRWVARLFSASFGPLPPFYTKSLYSSKLVSLKDSLNSKAFAPVE